MLNKYWEYVLMCNCVDDYNDIHLFTFGPINSCFTLGVAMK